jgi:hypothetical protein
MNNFNFKMGIIEKLFTGIVFSGFIFILMFSYSFKNRSNFNNNEHKMNQEDLENTICIIMTSEKTFIERSFTTWETWAWKCDRAIFACNCANFTKSFKSNRISEDIEYDRVASLLNNILQLDVVENYSFMSQKAILLLKTIYRLYNDQFKWFFLVDDDTYVFVENLKTFIRKLNHSEPFTYGFNFKNKELVSTGYHSGGGIINVN